MYKNAVKPKDNVTDAKQGEGQGKNKERDNGKGQGRAKRRGRGKGRLWDEKSQSDLGEKLKIKSGDEPVKKVDGIMVDKKWQELGLLSEGEGQGSDD